MRQKKVSKPVEQVHLVNHISRVTVYRTKGTIELGQGKCKVKAETLGPWLHRQTDILTDAERWIERR